MNNVNNSLETGMLERVNELLTALTVASINKPNELKQRYLLLRQLYTELRPLFKDHKEREKCEDNIVTICKELDKRRRGFHSTKVIYYCDKFEWQLRDFIQNNINKQQQGDFYG
jgi:hypothetical protein